MFKKNVQSESKYYALQPKNSNYFGNFLTLQRSFYLSVWYPLATPSKVWKKNSSILCGNVCEEFSVTSVNLRSAIAQISRIYGTKSLPCCVVSPSPPFTIFENFIFPSHVEFSPTDTL